MSHGTQGPLGLLLAVGVLRLALALLDDDDLQQPSSFKTHSRTEASAPVIRLLLEGDSSCR